MFIHISKKSVIILMAMLILANFTAAEKQKPNTQRIYPKTIRNLMPQNAPAQLRLADSCAVYEGGDPAWITYPWVEGDELFKAYQNPGAACENAYPFSIDRVHTVVQFVGAGTVYLSADIEYADNTDPSCPVPGAMINMTPLYEYTIPEKNLYFITIPLDSPIVINEPFFVGLYWAKEGNPNLAALATDNTPVGCVSYNDWGEGYVDLDTVYTNPDDTGLIKTFRGRLILYSSGTIGGSGGSIEPMPAAEFVLPKPNEFVGANIDLWANDAAGSDIIAGVEFYYNGGGGWINIGSDISDNPQVRNGVTASGNGNGLSYQWNTTALPEGSYNLRAIITDTLGRADTTETSIQLDPTPPTPAFIQPVLGRDVCNGVDVQISCPDENLSYMTFALKTIPNESSFPIPIIGQSLGGDINNNPLDGNSSASGEFGDFCSGPAVAAMALKYWFGKGYSSIIYEGTQNLTDVQLMERLFTILQVRDNFGTLDEEFISGLNQYISSHNGGFSTYADRTPSIQKLYNWLLDDEYAVMVGISGDPGIWMILSGAKGVAGPDEDHTFTLINPATSLAADYLLNDQSGDLLIFYDYKWVTVDIVVGLIPDDWTVSRTDFGYDGDSTNGWGFYWNTSSLSQDSLYFLQTVAADSDNNTDSESILVRNDGANSYIPGDVNNDGTVNPGDLVYLINYIYLNQSPPPAGANVANVNGDLSIDLADVLYLYKYLFLEGTEPQ